MKRCVIGASSLCTTVVWNVWSWTTSLDVHCSGPHKRRLSSQQYKKLCACVSCLSSNCSFRVLAVRFDLIRFDLTASLRRVSHWSAQDPFFSFVGFCFSSAWKGVSANKVHVLAEMLGFLGLREAVPQ